MYTYTELLELKPTQLKSIGKKLGVNKLSSMTWEEYAKLIYDAQDIQEVQQIKPEEAVIFSDDISLFTNDAPNYLPSVNSDDLTKSEVAIPLKGDISFYVRNNIPYCSVCSDVIRRDILGRKTCKRLDCPN